LNGCTHRSKLQVRRKDESKKCETKVQSNKCAPFCAAAPLEEAVALLFWHGPLQRDDRWGLQVNLTSAAYPLTNNPRGVCLCIAEQGWARESLPKTLLKRKQRGAWRGEKGAESKEQEEEPLAFFA
jgi:hypothetical protein